jgi:hypothetical protein
VVSFKSFLSSEINLEMVRMSLGLLRSRVESLETGWGKDFTVGVPLVLRLVVSGWIRTAMDSPTIKRMLMSPIPQIQVPFRQRSMALGS